MIELSIHFTSNEKDEASPITVDLFRPDLGTRTEPVPFEPPLGEAALDDLAWYLEVFASWPTGPDYDRAERIRARLEGWGRGLLAAVTPGRDAAGLWRDFERDGTEGRLVTVDAVEPRVLRLPWELLANDAGHLFAQGIGLRRRLAKATAGPIRPFALPVRLLAAPRRPGCPGRAGCRRVPLPAHPPGADRPPARPRRAAGARRPL